jgi:hypothetical protein
MPAHKSGESIEGLRIEGHSRKPLRSKPVQKIHGQKHFGYKVEFNVFAKIAAGLSPDMVPDKKIEKDALITEGETLGCDTAVIITIAKDRTQKAVSHVSHTHGANTWEFKQHTNIKVITPRKEIMDALQKRNDRLEFVKRGLFGIEKNIPAGVE